MGDVHVGDACTAKMANTDVGMAADDQERIRMRKRRGEKRRRRWWSTPGKEIKTYQRKDEL